MLRGTDALRLVAARAEAMDAASHGEEGLAFVRGLTRAMIDTLCEAPDIAVAIVNPGDGFVVGGTLVAMDEFESAARHRGATRIARLEVHIASHTKRLAAASADFTDILKRADILPTPPPGVRLFAGIDGSAILDSATGIPKLADQISQTVEWASCAESCFDAGATTFLELGPERALSAMIVDAHPEARSRSTEDYTTLPGLRGWVEANAL